MSSITFALYGIGMSWVHVFRTADIHEVLPPILACFLVREMALLDVTAGAYDQAPPGVRGALHPRRARHGDGPPS